MMKITMAWRTAALLTAVGMITGCSGLAHRPQESMPTDSRVLYDFEASEIPTNVVAEDVRLDLVSVEGVTSGRQALQVVYPRDTLYKKVAFEPEVSWNITEKGNYCIALDAANHSPDSVQLYITIKTTNQSVTAHASIGAGESVTCFYDLSGPNTALEPGMTGWPARQAEELGSGKVVPFRYAWGDRVLDLSSLNYIGLYMKGNLTDRTMVYDRIRIVSNPVGDAASFAPLVDEFGQYVGVDWPGKAASEADLKKQIEEEIRSWVMETGPKDRSKFGGWRFGPRLEATGYFRTAKVDERWTLVDPEGWLFFATGIANCRLSNTYTVTGVDYENAETGEGKAVKSELRRNMFSWLPEKNDPLVVHYG